MAEKLKIFKNNNIWILASISKKIKSISIK